MAIESVDRCMRGEGAPSPIYEGEDSIIAYILSGPDKEYTVPLPNINEEKKAVVVESRLLGRSSLIHLSLPIHSKVGNKTKHLHARVPGVVLPRPGAIVGVELDLSQVFVFRK